jgi:hypothetical protein
MVLAGPISFHLDVKAPQLRCLLLTQPLPKVACPK